MEGSGDYTMVCEPNVERQTEVYQVVLGNDTVSL